MKIDVKDVSFCQHSRHMVPRDQMTKLRSEDGKSSRNVCLACREEVMVLRVKVKK